MKILIVDDDSSSHVTLKKLLQESELNDIQEIQSSYDVATGIKLAKEWNPDLLFLDIELPDGLGFDLLSQFQNPDFHVIFVTAFDKFALTAIRFGALDYLLKPITLEKLSHPLTRVREKIQYKQIEILWDTYQKVQEFILPSRIVVPNQTGFKYLDVKDIVWLEASNVWTIFHLASTKQQIVSSTNLGEYQKHFEPYHSFVRVHRSHLINLTFVQEFRRGDRVAVLKDQTEIPISRGFLDDFLKGMDQLKGPFP